MGIELLHLFIEEFVNVMVCHGCSCDASFAQASRIFTNTISFIAPWCSRI